MTGSGYAHFADALVFAHGPAALREAIRQAELCRRTGDMDMEAHWQATIAEMKSFKNLVPSEEPPPAHA